MIGFKRKMTLEDGALSFKQEMDCSPNFRPTSVTASDGCILVGANVEIQPLELDADPAAITGVRKRAASPLSNISNQERYLKKQRFYESSIPALATFEQFEFDYESQGISHNSGWGDIPYPHAHSAETNIELSYLTAQQKDLIEKPLPSPQAHGISPESRNDLDAGSCYSLQATQLCNPEDRLKEITGQYQQTVVERGESSFRGDETYGDDWSIQVEMQSKKLLQPAAEQSEYTLESPRHSDDCLCCECRLPVQEPDATVPNAKKLPHWYDGDCNCDNCLSFGSLEHTGLTSNPNPARRDHEQPVNQTGADTVYHSDDETLATSRATSSVEGRSADEDTYSVASSDEEDMARLAESLDGEARRITPTSPTAASTNNIKPPSELSSYLTMSLQHGGRPVKTPKLMTYFNIDEMIREAARCLETQQDVTFELYSVVRDSQRDTSNMIQHFSFRNYGSSMGTPCLRGTMAAWVDGSVRDRQSLAFLSPSRSMMCRCVCKLDRDENSDFGWVAEVLFIRETDYDEAYFMNRVTRGSLSS